MQIKNVKSSSEEVGAEVSDHSETGHKHTASGCHTAEAKAGASP